MCVKRVFNAWYSCVKCMNLAWFSLLIRCMLNLWCQHPFWILVTCFDPLGGEIKAKIKCFKLLLFSKIIWRFLWLLVFFYCLTICCFFLVDGGWNLAQALRILFYWPYFHICVYCLKTQKEPPICFSYISIKDPSSTRKHGSHSLTSFIVML